MNHAIFRMPLDGDREPPVGAFDHLDKRIVRHAAHHQARAELVQPLMVAGVDAMFSRAENICRSRSGADGYGVDIFIDGS